MPPEVRCQSPSDLYAGCKRRIERRHVKTNKPDEGSVSLKLNGAQAESVLPEMRLDSICQRITFFLRKNVRHEFHYARIGIHAGERLPVGVAPMAEDQALGRKTAKNHWQRLNDLGFDGLKGFTQLTTKDHENLRLLLNNLRGRWR